MLCIGFCVEENHPWGTYMHSVQLLCCRKSACVCFLSERRKKPMDQSDHRSDQIRYKSYGSLDWLVGSSTVHFHLCLSMYLYTLYNIIYICVCTCIIYTQVHSWNDDPQRNHIFFNQGGSMNRKIRLSIFIESSPFSKRCRACRDLSEKDGWAMCVHVFCVWCGRKWDRDSLANVEHVCPIQSCSGGCFSTEMPLRAFFASQHIPTFARCRWCFGVNTPRNARREHQKSFIRFIVQMLTGVEKIWPKPYIVYTKRRLPLSSGVYGCVLKMLKHRLQMDGCWKLKWCPPTVVWCLNGLRTTHDRWATLTGSRSDLSLDCRLNCLASHFQKCCDLFF